MRRCSHHLNSFPSIPTLCPSQYSPENHLDVRPQKKLDLPTLRIPQWRSQLFFSSPRRQSHGFSFHKFRNQSTYFLSQIWNLVKGTLAYSMFGHSGEIKTSAFSNQGDFFATGGVDGALLIWKNGFSDEKGESILQKGLCETGHRVDERTKPTV